ncbi:MAG TPA: 2-amino-4-hydroxy-6-hydroxymethyldihydropteridine diphosphokinase [Chitinivibrionales bacterium]
MNIAAISVGSNIEAPRYIALAKETLQKEQTFLKESAFVTTAPIGTCNQPDFLNGAFLIGTELDLETFRGYLKKLEDRLGRVRQVDKFGPRTIDLDIVAWNGEIINDDFYERDFVTKAVEELGLP